MKRCYIFAFLLFSATALAMSSDSDSPEESSTSLWRTSDESWDESTEPEQEALSSTAVNAKDAFLCKVRNFGNRKKRERVVPLNYLPPPQHRRIETRQAG